MIAGQGQFGRSLSWENRADHICSRCCEPSFWSNLPEQIARLNFNASARSGTIAIVGTFSRRSLRAPLSRAFRRALVQSSPPRHYNAIMIVGTMSSPPTWLIGWLALITSVISLSISLITFYFDAAASSDSAIASVAGAGYWLSQRWAGIHLHAGYLSQRRAEHPSGSS